MHGSDWNGSVLLEILNLACIVISEWLCKNSAVPTFFQMGCLIGVMRESSSSILVLRA
jgi:hypothetical protein